MSAFRLAGVIGHPVGHSLSPRLHSFWLQELSIPGAYVPLDVAPGDLPAAIAGLKALGFAGANVTVPHKVAVMALIDELDPVAKAVGAVNTLVIERGGIQGRNTDAGGFMAHLEASLPSWRSRLGDRNVLVLGAGGAARAIVYALMRAGVSAIVIANRSHERAQALSAGRAHTVRWEDRVAAIPQAGLIINTTSLGMRGHPPLELDLAAAPRDAIVYDLVYNPLPTELLCAAAARGLVAIDGLGMLIHQARAGFAAWFGAAPPINQELHRWLASALPS